MYVTEKPKELLCITRYSWLNKALQAIHTLGKTKQQKPPQLPIPPLQRADPRLPAPNWTHHSGKTSALPLYAGPCLSISFARANIGEPGPQTPPQQTPQLHLPALYAVLHGSSSCEAKWSPLALIPHTCMAPHRCGRGPRCWWCSQKALESLSKAPVPFVEHGCSCGKALLPVPNCDLFTFLIELWIFLPLQPMIHTSLIFFSVKFCST